MVKAMFIAALLFVLVSSTVIAGGLPKGSFLNAPVVNVEQLSQQVVDDAVVAARYAKHFGTSRNAVVEYFQDNLKAGRLKTSWECTVYMISEKTDIVSTHKVLSAGTYVFAAADGRPMLDAVSGNPLTDAMPIASFKSSSRSKTAGQTAVAADDVVTKVLGASAAEIGTPAMSANAGALAVAAGGAAVTDPAVELVASIPIGATETSVHRPSSMLGILPIAALVGGLAAAGGGGGHNSPSATTNAGNTEIPVPEPSSISLVMACGMGIVLTRVRGRR